MCLCTFTWALFAQNGRESISGVIKDPDGEPVARIPVRLKNAASGAFFSTLTGANGQYAFKGLPPGKYDLTVPKVGFVLSRSEKKGIAVEAAQSFRADFSLQWAGNLGTPGDDDSTFVRRHSVPLTGPTPRAPDGKPDLSGLWNGSNDPDPEDPAALPWAEAAAKERIASNFKDSPSVHCLPDPPYLEGPLFYKFVQTRSLLVSIFENPPNVRQVFLDGRGHPKDVNPTWMGHSVGHWDGDTLVVDTAGFHERSWVGPYPHTEKLHVIERYHRPDRGHLDVEITIEDPGAFVRPWKIRETWDLVPNGEIQEYVCNENNTDAPHLVGK
jgi:hypothetical protein